MSMFISAILCLLVLIHAHAAFTLISASSVPESPPVIMRGICQLVGENISGTVLLQQLSNGGPTSIVAAISGLTPGKHGFHVHEYGDLRDSCKACGRHFNPFSLTHGHPDDAMRHVGDLNNAFANANGNAMVDMTDIQVKTHTHTHTPNTIHYMNTNIPMLSYTHI
jgi:Cu/Zn superoxide dismutase